MRPCDKTFKPSELKVMVKKYFNLGDDENDIVLGKTDIKFASDGLIGYQGEYFRMTINVDIKGKPKKLFLFIKSLPDTERGKNFTIDFCRELNVYRIIFPEFEKVQKCISYRTPALFVSENLMVFEDLITKGYAIRNSRLHFDKQHCVVALKSLAELHASSIIYEETKRITTSNKNYNLTDEYSHILKDCMYKFDGWYSTGIEAGIEAAGESKKYGKGTKYYTEVKSKWPQFFKDALEQSRPSKLRRNVISHMDLWAHNLMFNYSGNKPLHCIFVDFQSAICLPLQADVVSLLYLNLTSDQRSLLYNDLIQYYYSQLEQQLNEHGLKISSIMSWDSFVEDCEAFKKFALVQTIVLQQMALLEPKAAEILLQDQKDYHRIINVSRKELVLGLLESDSLFKRRYIDSLDDLIGNFIIDKSKDVMKDT